MGYRLIIDESSVYEIDEECESALRTKKAQGTPGRIKKQMKAREKGRQGRKTQKGEENT